MFGKMLKERTEGVGINMSGLVMDEQVRTTLAFVHTYPDGDRDFSFYRNPGADMMLNRGELNREMIQAAKIFHFGTLSMTDEGVEAATKEAVSIAKESKALLSFDPNLRPPLWSSEEKAKEKIAYGLSQCDILKISDNEIVFMTGCEDLDEGIHKIQEQYHIPLIFATYGKDGSKAFYQGMEVEVEGFINPNTIETTGAGDTFGACSLNYVIEHGIDPETGKLKDLNMEELVELLTFANAAASLITTKKGALCVMPSREEVEEYIQSW